MKPSLFRLLGSGLYSGLSPFAPGTTGTMAALFILFLLTHWLSLWISALLLFLCSVILNYLTADTYCASFGEDPSSFVLDEWAGLSFVFLFPTALTDQLDFYYYLIFGFLLFRLFDITKPLGIDPLQNISGANGILFDDLLAGIYAIITLNILIFAIL